MFDTVAVVYASRCQTSEVFALNVLLDGEQQYVTIYVDVKTRFLVLYEKPICEVMALVMVHLKSEHIKFERISFT